MNENQEFSTLDELKFKRWIQSVTADSGKKIEESDAFLSLYTDNYVQAPQCALELGIAIMLDKPIVILAPKGQKIPEVLIRLAQAVEFFDPEDDESFRMANERIMEKLNV